MFPTTPRGFRDVLNEEARERAAVAGAMTRVFESWGYDPVETPLVEEYETLAAGMGPELEETAFRLFDLDGSLLALRPEMTVPIARLVATRLAGSEEVHRISYVADVFREHASLRGQARQFTQVGVEMIGAAGPVADAEVALLLIEALEAAGLESFTVGIGTTDAIRVLLEKAAQSEEWTDAVLASVQEGNLVELDRLTRTVELDEPLGEALRELPRLRGGREAIERADKLAIAAGCVNTVCNVRQAWITIEELGLAHRASVDFGIMRSFGYYTGLQLEASAPGLGLPLAGGGRYNRLLGGYGAAQAAAGFAIGLERVMIALAEQGRTPALAPLDAVIGGADPIETFAAARRLREAGWRVRVAPGRGGAWVACSAEQAGAIDALLVHEGGIVRLDGTGQPLAELGDPLPAPPSAAGRGGAA